MERNNYVALLKEKQKVCVEIARCTASGTSARLDNIKGRYRRFQQDVSYYC
jgi:gamma-glutamylcyclotransferase (GGCT)/AIG2-like uncharacterized protein YtfP